MKFAKIRQLFEHNGLASVEDSLACLLDSSKFQKAIAARKHIAIAVGSRGISNIVTIVKALVGHLKDFGIEPIIVPAMGSHGSATAEGQAEVLEKLGINERTVGAEVRSSMDVIRLRDVKMDGRLFGVHVDRAAWQSDGVILINRVKQHSDYTGRYESGLVKMAAVGLGNHEGASQVHSAGIVGLKELIPALAKVVLGNNKVIGGFALVEDAYHETAEMHWLNSDEIMPRESGLLEKAKALMPHLPVDDIDLLIIKQMGKDISGVGIDPKTIGRLMIRGEQEPAAPRIELIAICGISAASCGNALGIGLGDFITRELFGKVDFQAVKENILTSTFYERGKIPIVLESEREIVEVAQRHFERRGSDKISAIIIKDTLSLSQMYVTEAVLGAVAEPGKLEIVEPAQEIGFDSEGKIIAPDFPCSS
jgi:hypothetical protein